MRWLYSRIESSAPRVRQIFCLLSCSPPEPAARHRLCSTGSIEQAVIEPPPIYQPYTPMEDTMVKTEHSHIMIGAPAGRPVQTSTPATTQPKTDTAVTKAAPVNFKEIGMAIGIIAIAGVALAAWLMKDQPVTGPAGIEPQAAGTETVPFPPVPTQTPIPPRVSDSSPSAMEADLYFDVKKSKLSDESKELLQHYADILTKESRWGLFVQGYADLTGRPEYNKALGLRRAEAVKRFLVESGVSESSIRVVSLGKEGTLCDDAGEECRKLNRRVHLELRRGGLPVIAPPPEEETPEATESASTTPEIPSAPH
jgi:peptidoglycan-associated lipoprotein